LLVADVEVARDDDRLAPGCGGSPVGEPAEGVDLGATGIEFAIATAGLEVGPEDVVRDAADVDCRVEHPLGLLERSRTAGVGPEGPAPRPLDRVATRDQDPTVAEFVLAGPFGDLVAVVAEAARARADLREPDGLARSLDEDVTGLPGEQFGEHHDVRPRLHADDLVEDGFRPFRVLEPGDRQVLEVGVEPRLRHLDVVRQNVEYHGQPGRRRSE
jgi:hypothetical protein